MKNINRYLERLDHNAVPANKESLRLNAPTVITKNSEELIMLFGSGWWRPFNRATAVAARATAEALLAGWREPKVIETKKCNQGWGPDFKYAWEWVVEFSRKGEPVAIKPNGAMPTDTIFGRGNDNPSIRWENDRLVIYAEC